ncbi:MAG: co-chaperone YbbN [Betaproteobacteria bacterium]|nr:co-chaperone YbbN [Betaproteobacteria bacterium]NBT10522.1 co-chaperone YbbN [Betaproteobacteria bacterium]NBU49782.1 co-chaperone YbbN [Betaproteobacteria bacterium]NBX96041.1 co-chaperone YbbN [Betaproteobacteria bacterium]
MIDITLQNFESELIQGSAQQPVLLDIWAPWCGPCRTLGPMLERLEVAYAGRFKLAKLNSDEQPQIAGQLSQMFGVRSIPFCVMFSQGQPVDGFVGALPESQIREFLDKHVPSPDELEAQAEIEEAEALIEEGDAEAALNKLQAALQADPNNDVARFDLIKLMLEGGDTASARSVFEPVAGRFGLDARLVAAGHWIGAMEAAGHARSPDQLQAAIDANRRDFDARFELAQTHFAAGRFTQAMDELLEIIMRDKVWNEELARKTYVAILEIITRPQPKPAAAEAGSTKGGLELTGKSAVPSGDPVVDQYRRKLSMALF